MSKRAEQKANERWPIHPWTILPKEGEHGEIINFDEWLDDYRIWVQSFSANRGYEEGYEQAEKDMMERAVETVVSLESGGFPFIEHGVGELGLKVGDKVKLIIVKED